MQEDMVMKLFRVELLRTMRPESLIDLNQFYSPYQVGLTGLFARSHIPCLGEAFFSGVLCQIEVPNPPAQALMHMAMAVFDLIYHSHMCSHDIA